MIYSLPLLEGLFRRPEASQQVLEDAIKRYQAAKCIAKWISGQHTAVSCTNEPRRKRRRCSSSKTALDSNANPHLHWLFQALTTSPALSVRQMAARILLQHKKEFSLILGEILVHCLSLHSNNHNSSGDVQCFGVLQELPLTTLSCLSWACRAVLESCRSRRRSSTNTNSRLVLLLHYLQHCSKQSSLLTDYLWLSCSTNNKTTVSSKQSPLASLICAHSLLVQQCHSTKAVRLLGHLIDPGRKSDTTANASSSTALQTSTTLKNNNNATATLEALQEEDDDDDENNDDVEMEEVEDKEYEEDDEEIESEEDHDDDDDEEEEDANDDEDDDDDEEEGDEQVEEEEVEEEEEEEEETHDAEITETEQEIVDVVRHFEARLLDINDGDDQHDQSRPSSSSGLAPPPDGNRKQAYLQATLQVLGAQYTTATLHKTNTPFSLTPSAEQHLLQSICNVIVPPKKPLNLKVFMRRAPTQEEFFRGSLPRNPISSSHLATPDPTVRELRQYIADQLQMSETAELIEVLCANKILNLDLKLRVVNQVLWKTHLLENSSSVFSSSLLSGGGTFFSTGSGLSMVFSSDRGGGRANITADTPASSLPPMVVTYRLAGVDGEATEDIVEQLEDPEAPSSTMSAEEQETMMETKFGLTRLVTDGRGIHVLMRSIQSHVRDSLRRIRRDDVVFRRSKSSGKRCDKNASLQKFEKSPPCAGLKLMKHCTNLPSNRKKLVDARAPTILLRLLLDVLNAIDDSSNTDESESQTAQAVSNPTAVMLEDLIETLASDISTDDDTTEDDMEEGSSTLPLLLSSLKHIYLGPQLRKVIAKLLPFLTYGQSSLARELAENFESHIKVEKLVDCEAKEQPKTRRFVLMDTFVQAAVCLPPNAVCHSLRSELIKCGFVQKLMQFILNDMPDQPPPWSAALWTTATKKGDVADLEQSWKYYFLRSGIKTAFDMLVGLCRGHADLQALVASYGNDDDEPHRFMHACHWIESTSDNKTVRIYLNGMGLLAETLLDELKEPQAETCVKEVRRKTRDRKKEIADERRSKALVSMSCSFGPAAAAAEGGVGGAIRNSASSFLAPVLGFFSGDSASAAAASKTPAWMAEMEALEDETGLTCAVCQEGRTLQPSELLGLYCYVKKVSIPQNKGGGRPYIDGTMLLIALPDSLPTSLVDTPVEHHWYSKAKASGDGLRTSHASYLASSSSSRRPTQVTTTVSAGNAIHCSCHSKARSADRNHPKAPKSEWEGASLRNSRVNCNVILPLVSSKSSKVPLVAVDMALTDYQTAIANLLGARPKAMLWAVLNDVRLLLLRMAYGEALNADCGGGSMSSNAALVFYQLLLADMFTNDAEHDSPETARHARCLSGGFLAASKILRANDYEDDGNDKPSLSRAISDAAPMAALSCIVYHNTKDEDSAEPEKDAMVPHPKRRWECCKEDFLRGLLQCAGRRHALGIEDSGGQTSRKNRPRQSSFSEWDMVVEDDHHEAVAAADESEQSAPKRSRSFLRSIKIEDFSLALRPMVTLYAILDSMSSTYVPNMGDEMIEESATLLAKRVEECQKTNGIHDLLRKAGIVMDHDAIVEELQKGMVAA